MIAASGILIASILAAYLYLAWKFFDGVLEATQYLGSARKVGLIVIGLLLALVWPAPVALELLRGRKGK